MKPQVFEEIAADIFITYKTNPFESIAEGLYDHLSDLDQVENPLIQPACSYCLQRKSEDIYCHSYM